MIAWNTDSGTHELPRIHRGVQLSELETTEMLLPLRPPLDDHRPKRRPPVGWTRLAAVIATAATGGVLAVALQVAAR